MARPTIVALRDDLVPAVLAMYRELGDEIADSTGDDYFVRRDPAAPGPEHYVRACLHDDDLRILVALVDGEAAGFLTAQVMDCFLPFSAVKKIGYIGATYVAPPFRRRGITRLLEEEALAFFRGRGLEYAELHFISRNEAARRTWNALGYETFREQARKKT